jgi:hypothetical protein
MSRLRLAAVLLFCFAGSAQAASVQYRPLPLRLGTDGPDCTDVYVFWSGETQAVALDTGNERLALPHDEEHALEHGLAAGVVWRDGQDYQAILRFVGRPAAMDRLILTQNSTETAVPLRETLNPVYPMTFRQIRERTFVNGLHLAPKGRLGAVLVDGKPPVFQLGPAFVAAVQAPYRFQSFTLEAFTLLRAPERPFRAVPVLERRPFSLPEGFVDVRTSAPTEIPLAGPGLDRGLRWLGLLPQQAVDLSAFIHP